MKKNMALFVAIGGTSLSGGGRALAQDRPSQSAGQNVSRAGSPKSDVPEATSDADIQMLRRDLRSQKKQIVAANMDSLTPKQRSFGQSTNSTRPIWSKSTTRRLL